MTTPTTTVAANHRHWPADARGCYEVWYVTWNHPRTDQGYWLRFITENPLEGEPRAELWFARFDANRPARTFGIHRPFPASVLASHREPFEIAIAGSQLRHDGSTGRLAGDGHDVRWDLRWEPADHVLRQLPDVMYLRGGLGETTVCSPNPLVPLSGSLVIDGEEVTFDRVPAGQTHLYGRKHAYAWVWGRCADFLGAPHCALELLAVRLQRRGVTLPPMTLVTLELGSERFAFNQFRNVAINRSTWRTGYVHFTAWSPLAKIEGELACAPDRLINAPYVDPDGTEVWCANTEVGDARIELSVRSGLGWKTRTLEGPRRAHFETGGRTRDPAVARTHVRVT
ncbi:MAG: hypothetical protein KF773_30415 [Deltaproteobacteria bacterium]|nr:hypothetical protein [Deltaproteobacteria bacterium]MCW5805080.1 hypothetical protein [Deltaproteobacteria bacterium]